MMRETGLTLETDLLLTSGVARLCGVDSSTVRLWERMGRIQAIRTVGTRGTRLYTRAEVERVLSERAAARQDAELGKSKRVDRGRAMSVADHERGDLARVIYRDIVLRDLADIMRGTLAPVLHEYGVTFRVMHGFTSATSAYDVAQMIEEETRRVIVFYVGDWDPSGLFMSDEDLPNRLADYGAEPDEFIRLALTESDIRDPDLPSFHASDKDKDPRYRWFINQYGHLCWELDALSPVVLRDRLEAAIRGEIDWQAWRRCELAEQAETKSLRQVLTAWSEAKHG